MTESTISEVGVDISNKWIGNLAESSIREIHIVHVHIIGVNDRQEVVLNCGRRKRSIGEVNIGRIKAGPTEAGGHG